MVVANVSDRLDAKGRAQRDGLTPLRVGAGRWVVASSSRPGVGYTLTMAENGKLSCDCPGGGYDCKHKAAVRISLENERNGVAVMEEGAPASWPAVTAPAAEPVPVTIPERFWVERQGRKFVTYAGVLDAATRTGLCFLSARLVQFGSDENGLTWIAEAIARFADGREFQEFADASPANVSRAMLVHMPRLAATRAKARALRDAVNVGTAALEELADDGAAHQVDQRDTAVLAVPASGVGVFAPEPPRVAGNPDASFDELFGEEGRGAAFRSTRPAELDFPIAQPEPLPEPFVRPTERQWAMLYRCASDAGLDEADVDTVAAGRWPVGNVQECSRKQISALIDEFKARKRA